MASFEDWGGKGLSKMNLSGRDSALHTWADLRQRRELSMFSCTMLKETAWILGRRVTLSKNTAQAAGTFFATVLPEAELQGGYFNQDIEIFVVSGSIQVGDWVLKKHGYMFVPAGVHLAGIKFLSKALGKEGAEMLWMENGDSGATYEAKTGCVTFTHTLSDEHTAAGADRLSEFVAPLDATYLGWVQADTAQFATSRKKWLRRAENGGGCWLLHILPHYCAKASAIQNYNEEAFCIQGVCDIGELRFKRGDFAYCPTGTMAHLHSSPEGCTCFVRIDRDLKDGQAVISHRELPPASVDWSVESAKALPGPATGIVPRGFLRHVGTWEGTYTHIGRDGLVQDKHACKLEIGIHGIWYSQRNTYTWHDASSGEVTKSETYLFPGRFTRDGVVWIDAEKISGWGRALDDDGTVLFYGGYKPATMTADSKISVDTFDLIRIVDIETEALIGIEPGRLKQTTS